MNKTFALFLAGAMVFGILAGLGVYYTQDAELIKQASGIFGLLPKVFIMLIKMIIALLVLFTLIAGVGGTDAVRMQLPRVGQSFALGETAPIPNSPFVFPTILGTRFANPNGEITEETAPAGETLFATEIRRNAIQDILPISAADEQGKPFWIKFVQINPADPPQSERYERRPALGRGGAVLFTGSDGRVYELAPCAVISLPSSATHRNPRLPCAPSPPGPRSLSPSSSSRSRDVRAATMPARRQVRAMAPFYDMILKIKQRLAH